MRKNFTIATAMGLFWFLTYLHLQPSNHHSSPQKKSWNDRNGAAPEENAGRLKSSHPFEKERKTSPSFIQFFGLFGVQLLLCFQTCVWSTDIHFNRIIDKPPKANQKKKSNTKNTSQNAPKKWKNHLANQGFSGHGRHHQRLLLFSTTLLCCKDTPCLGVAIGYIGWMEWIEECTNNMKIYIVYLYIVYVHILS